MEFSRLITRHDGSFSFATAAEEVLPWSVIRFPIREHAAEGSFQHNPMQCRYAFIGASYFVSRDSAVLDHLAKHTP